MLIQPSITSSTAHKVFSQGDEREEQEEEEQEEQEQRPKATRDEPVRQEDPVNVYKTWYIKLMSVFLFTAYLIYLTHSRRFLKLF